MWARVILCRMGPVAGESRCIWAHTRCISSALRTGSKLFIGSAKCAPGLQEQHCTTFMVCPLHSTPLPSVYHTSSGNCIDAKLQIERNESN